MDATHEGRETRHFYISVKEKTMNTRYIPTLCTALAISGALITGSAHAVSKADEKTPINDTVMTAKTKIALFADARVKGSEITVETSQGSVIIRGKVDSDEAKQVAEGIAAGIDGVKSVKSEVQIVAPAKREAINDRDSSITIRVIAKIAQDYALHRAGIHAQTNAGVVSLSGQVSSLLISAQPLRLSGKFPA
jgi:hyperosmotically inducible periplasmic protein